MPATLQRSPNAQPRTATTHVTLMLVLCLRYQTINVTVVLHACTILMFAFFLCFFIFIFILIFIFMFIFIFILFLFFIDTVFFMYCIFHVCKCTLRFVSNEKCNRNKIHYYYYYGGQFGSYSMATVQFNFHNILSPK